MKGTNRQLDLSNCCNLILGTSGIGSKLAQQLMTSAIVHVLWIIWIERNKRYFHGIHANIGTLINRVMSEVHLSFDLVLARGTSYMTDFCIAQLFHVPLRPPRTGVTTDIFWIHPKMGCIKINVDGSSYGSPSIGTIGAVLNIWQAGFLGCFVQNIGHATPLEAEFSALMFAIEKAVEQNLSVVWLDSDSLMVVNAFNTNGDAGVLWRLRVRWNNCKQMLISLATNVLMHFMRATWLRTLWQKTNGGWLFAHHNGGKTHHSLFFHC
jgi:ribonuclease HI